MGYSDNDWYWGDSLDSATGGGRQEVEAMWSNMLEMVGVVLSAGRWVQVELTIANIEKLGQRLCKLRFHSCHSSIWKIFIVKSPVPLCNCLKSFC